MFCEQNQDPTLMLTTRVASFFLVLAELVDFSENTLFGELPSAFFSLRQLGEYGGACCVLPH